jgi:hypothetical protein
MRRPCGYREAFGRSDELPLEGDHENAIPELLTDRT